MSWTTLEHHRWWRLWSSLIGIVCVVSEKKANTSFGGQPSPNPLYTLFFIIFLCREQSLVQHGWWRLQSSFIGIVCVVWEKKAIHILAQHLKRISKETDKHDCWLLVKWLDGTLGASDSISWWQFTLPSQRGSFMEKSPSPRNAPTGFVCSLSSKCWTSSEKA